MKDEQLLKDGFKKFLKTESCRVDGCRFTMICNHIHCVRTNCNFILHSSGQLLSHKRKHERMDAEMAYRRFKMGETAKDLTPSELAALQSFHGLDLSLKPPAPPAMNQFPVADQATTEKFNKLLNVSDTMQVSFRSLGRVLISCYYLECHNGEFEHSFESHRREHLKGHSRVIEGDTETTKRTATIK